jgi:hypothetical protein
MRSAAGLPLVTISNRSGITQKQSYKFCQYPLMSSGCYLPHIVMSIY